MDSHKEANFGLDLVDNFYLRKEAYFDLELADNLGSRKEANFDLDLVDSFDSVVGFERMVAVVEQAVYCFASRIVVEVVSDMFQPVIFLSFFSVA